MDFKTMGLKADLLHALDALGFDTPTPIQAAALPELLDGKRDVIGLAQTGTGKTAAYGLPLLQRVDATRSHAQGVVLCPTRELCLQIAKDLNGLARYMRGIKVAAVYGGASMANQIRELRSGPQIVVATPGRLIDLMQRRTANLSGVGYLVLDEADEMLTLGFQEEIDRILEQLPAERLTWLFSATMPSGVAAIARNYLDAPQTIAVGGRQRLAANLTHTCYVMQERHRYPALKRIIDANPTLFGLVFCRTRKQTQKVADALVMEGYRADALHGDLSQSQRDHVMRKFRQRSIQLLVATDVAARGLDVQAISHIVHYHLPDAAETYTHRSGRTARAGRSGTSVVLVTPREVSRLRAMERRNAMRFVFAKIPNGREICEQQCAGFVDRVLTMPVDRQAMADYLPKACTELAELDREELILRMLTADLSRLVESYADAGDIDAAPRPPTRMQSDGGRGHRSTANASRRFFINVGRLDKINAGAIVRLVCDHCGIDSRRVGHIELKREFSFFEVDQRVADKVRRRLKDVRLDGRRVQVRNAGRKQSSPHPHRRAA